MVNYYIIPADSLPLLDPLRLIPILGQPLYDLFEPDTRILVNLGYGSIDQGWASGNADVVSTAGLFPTDINLGDLSTALFNGLQQGVSAFFADLGNPDTYKITPLLENPSLTDCAGGLPFRLPRLAATDALRRPARYHRVASSVHRYDMSCGTEDFGANIPADFSSTRDTQIAARWLRT